MFLVALTTTVLVDSYSPPPITPVNFGWCGCKAANITDEEKAKYGKQLCQPCCQRVNATIPYRLVWDAHAGKIDPRILWSIETYDPEGFESGSIYANDGTTVVLDPPNKKLRLRMLELPNYKTGPRYKSAKLMSWDSFTYGLFVVKTSHIPTGCGLWPAIWMVPSNSKYGVWPGCGELDMMEAINQGSFMATSMNYGSCERGQDENVSYCRHRSKDKWSPMGLADSSTYAMEWTPDSITYFHWLDKDRPADIDSPNPNPSTWKSQSLGTFWRPGAGGDKKTIPYPPYKSSYIDGVAGFVCPKIQQGDDKHNYDSRCIVGDQYCPGADTFQGRYGGGGCDFDAPFGPAVCDDYGMRLILNFKACGKWPASVSPGTECCKLEGGAYTHLNGLNGAEMIVDSVKVYQRNWNRTQQICCPYADAEPHLLDAAVETICGPLGLECSPIRLRGLYATENLIEKAKWVFNQYFQRNGAQPEHCADVCTSYISEGYSGCSILKQRPPTPGCDSSSSSSSSEESSSSESSSSESSSSEESSSSAGSSESSSEESSSGESSSVPSSTTSSTSASSTGGSSTVPDSSSSSSFITTAPTRPAPSASEQVFLIVAILCFTAAALAGGGAILCSKLRYGTVAPS